MRSDLPHGWQVDEARREGQITSAGLQMSHSAGFDAWVRNQQGLGKHGFYTAEDLLRQKRGGVEPTGSTSTPLPHLTTAAVCFDRHGPPEEVAPSHASHCMPCSLHC